MQKQKSVNFALKNLKRRKRKMIKFKDELGISGRFFARENNLFFYSADRGAAILTLRHEISGMNPDVFCLVIEDKDGGDEDLFLNLPHGAKFSESCIGKVFPSILYDFVEGRFHHYVCFVDEGKKYFLLVSFDKEKDELESVWEIYLSESLIFDREGRYHLSVSEGSSVKSLLTEENIKEIVKRITKREVKK
ncbi:MAG: hypothetical protein AB9915_03865 [Candidatus Dojkabacteria bacterium]